MIKIIILIILIFGLGFCFGVLFELKQREKDNEEWYLLAKRNNDEWAEYCGRLIEKIKILRTPCDIGQTVYTRYGYSFKIEQIEVLKDKKILFRCGNDGTDDYMAFYDFEIGTDVFLTKEEAEAKLKELNNNA